MYAAVTGIIIILFFVRETERHNVVFTSIYARVCANAFFIITVNEPFATRNTCQTPKGGRRRNVQAWHEEGNLKRMRLATVDLPFCPRLWYMPGRTRTPSGWPSRRTTGWTFRTSPRSGWRGPRRRRRRRWALETSDGPSPRMADGAEHSAGSRSRRGSSTPGECSRTSSGRGVPLGDRQRL